LEAMNEVLVKKLVVTDLVGRDVAADLHEHRFPHPVAQCRVVRAGPDLDHTARDHLSRTRAAARHFAIEIDAKALLKPVEGGGEIVIGVGKGGPPRQSAPVLDLLLAPTPRALLEVRVVIENSAQMVSVGAAVVFDEARRLDDLHDIRIELTAIEAVP